MLYRLGRYGGLAAFRGMLACDPPWVRPLLGCRRAETAAYCEAVGLEYARDRGNLYPGYARTAIRMQVLPAWERALPGAAAAAARSAEVAAEVERLVEALVIEARRWAAAPALAGAAQPPAARAGGCGEVLAASALLGLEPPLRRLLLHTWLEERARPAASRASVLAVEELLGVAGSAARSVGGGLRARKEYDRVWLEPVAGRAGAGAGVDPGAIPPVPAAGGSAAVPLGVPGRARWGGWVVTAAPASGTSSARYGAAEVAREAFVDARCLAGAVQVRGRRPGDRIKPLGAPGSRKVQDLLVDLKVPAAERDSIPLVVCDGRVVWVCGFAVAEEGRIAGDTADIVRLEVGPDDEKDGQR
jgi:tRNA(Ile)-lysidine synthase